MLSICLALLQNPEDKLRFEEFYNKYEWVIDYAVKVLKEKNEGKTSAYITDTIAF